MTIDHLPDWLCSELNNPPKAGGGVHSWLYRMARQLHAHLPAVEIVALLEYKVQNCGRHVPRSEIVAAVQNSMGTAWHPTGHATPPAQPTWPSVDERQRKEIINAHGGLADLWEASPVRMDSNAPRTEDFIDVLFPGNPLLCGGKSSRQFDTKLREEWRGELAGMALIVPSSMSDIEGLTRDGRPSRHTLNNTGPRRFLVVEQDSGTEDVQSAVLLHLATLAPLALVVHSGSKSLHGWFYCAGQPEEGLRKFMAYAVGLGADHATWSRAQFVRMPDGTRDNGRRQAVYFFNPEVIV